MNQHLTIGVSRACKNKKNRWTASGRREAALSEGDQGKKKGTVNSYNRAGILQKEGKQNQPQGKWGQDHEWISTR